jgi:hypothetical protein
MNQNTTNINDLPPVITDPMDVGTQSRLDEGQIRQLVTGIQDASMKGATRLKNSDIPSDPSRVSIDTEVIIPTQCSPPAIEPVAKPAPISQWSLGSLNIPPDIQIPLILGVIAVLPHSGLGSAYLKTNVSWLFTDSGSISIMGYIAYILMVVSIYYILMYVKANR